MLSRWVGQAIGAGSPQTHSESALKGLRSDSGDALAEGCQGL